MAIGDEPCSCSIFYWSTAQLGHCQLSTLSGGLQNLSDNWLQTRLKQVGNLEQECNVVRWSEKPQREFNPLTTDDAIWRCLTLAACYQLVQSVLKIGFVLAKKGG